MDETDWIACAEPTRMLNHLEGKASDRKLRLFMAACCRRVWHALVDEPERQAAVEVAEKYADGLADAEEMADAFGDLTDGNPIHIWDDCVNATVADFTEFDAVACALAEVEETAILSYGEDYDQASAIRQVEAGAQADLLRCI